jgi:hypothetical protein
MRKLILPATAAALLLAVGAAEASTATGEVDTINMRKHVITLFNGQTYVLDKSVKLAGIAPRHDVSITYKMVGGKRVATKVDWVFPTPEGGW